MLHDALMEGMLLFLVVFGWLQASVQQFCLYPIAEDKKLFLNVLIFLPSPCSDISRDDVS